MVNDEARNLPTQDIETSLYQLQISDDIIQYLDLSFTIPVHGLTALAGLVTNCFNVAIIFKLGLKNSMWVGAFALSLTDLCVTCLQLTVCCCLTLKYTNPKSDVDMWMMLVFAFDWIRYAGYYISCWITTVISIERCVCVVSPFRVRRIFTRARCVVVIVIIYASHIALILPIYVIQKVTWKNESFMGTNFTVFERQTLAVEFSDETSRLEIIIDAIAAVALSIISQIVLIVCTVWMIYALKSSSVIRHTTGGKDTVQGNRSFFDLKTTRLSNRELKLVKVVMGLALVLTVCNIPRYAVLTAYHTIPGMNIGKYRTISGFMWSLADFFGTINCSSNFLVYWALNEHFRKCFWNLFAVETIRKTNVWGKKS